MNNKFNYILYEARSFSKSYKLLKSQVETEEEAESYIIPSVVIMTFCTELYLKAILYYYNISFNKNKGHKLDYLFSLLSEINDSNAYKSYSNIEKSFEYKKKEKNNFFLYNSLKEMLKNENNSFEMWRYRFDDWKNFRCMFPASEFKILINCLEEECKALEKKIKEISIYE